MMTKCWPSLEKRLTNQSHLFTPARVSSDMWHWDKFVSLYRGKKLKGINKSAVVYAAKCNGLSDPQEALGSSIVLSGTRTEWSLQPMWHTGLPRLSISLELSRATTHFLFYWCWAGSKFCYWRNAEHLLRLFESVRSWEDTHFIRTQSGLVAP